MAARKKTKSKSSRKTSGAKRASPKKPKKPKRAKKPQKARKTKAAKRKTKARKRSAPARRALPRAAASASVVLEAVVLEAPAGRVEALQEKLKALKRVEDALNARRTNTPADDDEINPNLDALSNARRTVEAQIAAAQTQVLAPPSEADVTALRNAIRDAETAIAQNAKVNQLVRAASALIKALQA